MINCFFLFCLDKIVTDNRDIFVIKTSVEVIRADDEEGYFVLYIFTIKILLIELFKKKCFAELQ